MPASQSIFPTFFLSGFEGSTFLWKDQGRRDVGAEIKHLEHVQGDYAFLRELGIGVARECVPWPFIDQGGAYVFVVNDKNVAEQRRVKTGTARDGLLAVSEGLKAGEKVIIQGQQRVRPGMTVAPSPAPAAPAMPNR